jgi:pyridoxal phosphate enzyme (YggS family)
MTLSTTIPVPSAQGPSAPTNGDAAARLAVVQSRIRAAAADHGRAADTVVLLAVSKTFPAEALLALAACGQHHFGESYLQEALPKIEACNARWSGVAGAATGSPRLHWHFIGPIQSNKTRAIAETFDWVHSVDRERIAVRLNEQRPDSLPPLQVCIQVDVSGEATKSGCDPNEALALAQTLAALPRLRLRGLMAIPAPTDDPVEQRRQFSRVRELRDSLEAAGFSLDTLSMGMSADLESAIAEGATIVRVGSALFGERPRSVPSVPSAC